MKPDRRGYFKCKQARMNYWSARSKRRQDYWSGVWLKWCLKGLRNYLNQPKPTHNPSCEV